MKRGNKQGKGDEGGIHTENGAPAANLCWSPRSFAAETIFMDLVILAMFLVPVIRIFTKQGECVKEGKERREGFQYIVFQWQIL